MKTVNTQHTDRRHHNATIHTNILIILSCSGSGYRHKLACNDLHTKELTCSSDSYMRFHCFQAKKKRKMSDPDLHMKLSAQSSIANNTGALTSKPVTPSSEQRHGSFQTVRTGGGGDAHEVNTNKKSAHERRR